MFGRLPEVIRYDLPTLAELPANCVDWQIDPKRAALLIHDMQGYFLRPLAAGGMPYDALVSHIGEIRAACVAAGVPVTYTAQPGDMTPDERGLLKDIWGSGMSKEALDRGIVDALAPSDDDQVFTKWRYSAYHASNLLEWLREHGRDQLIITGVYAHVGVLVTAFDSYSRDVQTFIAADAVADFTREDHDLALGYAAARCAVVISTAELVDALSVDALSGDTLAVDDQVRQ